MLVHPIVDKLQSLRFFGMRCAFEEQMQTADIDQLNFEERMGLLVDREMTERENRRFKTRLRKAKLRLNACVEDVDFRHKRGLDKAAFMQLADCQWVKEAHNVLIIGPTGVGKTFFPRSIRLSTVFTLSPISPAITLAAARSDLTAPDSTMACASSAVRTLHRDSWSANL